MLITLQPDPNWQLSFAQLRPSLFCKSVKFSIVNHSNTDQKCLKQSIGYQECFLPSNIVTLRAFQNFSYFSLKYHLPMLQSPVWGGVGGNKMGGGLLLIKGTFCRRPLCWRTFCRRTFCRRPFSWQAFLQHGPHSHPKVELGKSICSKTDHLFSGGYMFSSQILRGDRVSW